MPRNVSRSSHELVTYTFALLYSEGHAQGAGRILADRIEFILSVFQRRGKSILRAKGRREIGGPLFLVSLFHIGTSPSSRLELRLVESTVKN
jgi:hypothetical protein